MNRFIATGLAISAIALIAPKTANAAALSINDASAEGSITFSVGQFDTGQGFVLDGTRILAPSSGTASATVSEGTAASGPSTHNFTGQFLTSGAFVAPTSGVIAFTEAGGGISDILTFSYTGGGGSPAGPFGTGTLTGSFVSDLEPGGSLVAPPNATLVSEATPFNFSNTNITASAVSDVEPVPAPIIGHGLLVLLAVGGVMFGGKLVEGLKKRQLHEA